VPPTVRTQARLTGSMMSVFGCVKTVALMGRAFAEATLRMMDEQ
jgi:hypothetical protein